MAKKLQLLRNGKVFDTKALALDGIYTQLKTLAAGEPAIASYTDGDKVSILLGISYGDRKNYQIFEGAKVGEDNNLEIPEEIKNEINKKLTESKSYTDQKIEALDAADAAVARNFVTEVSEVNGVIKVKRGAVTSTGKTITITDGLDGGINLDVVSSALTQYVGKDAIEVGAESDGQKEISLKLNAADKVLTQDESGLLANIKLTWDKVSGLKLIGKDETVISTINSTDFIKDGMLEDVKLVKLSEGTETNPQGLENGTYLKFTFNTDASKTEIYVNVTSLIDIYTGTNGIQVSGKEISAVKDPSSEGFLEITSNGIKVSGIQNAIDSAKGVEQAAIDKIEASVGLSAEGNYVAPTGSTYLGSSTTVMDALDKLDGQIKANADAIAAAEAAAISVVAGNGIEVTGEGTEKTITAKAKADDPIIIVSEEGIGTKDNAVWDCGLY